MNEDFYHKKINKKSRVKKQTKKKVSKTSGTLSQQVKRNELTSKRKKQSITVKISH